MNGLKNYLITILSSKTNIFSSCLALLFALLDIKGLINNFSANLVPIGIFLLVLIAGFIIHFLTTAPVARKQHPITEEKIPDRTEYHSADSSGQGSQTLQAVAQSRKLWLPTILVSMIVFFAITTAGSIYYVRDADIYYVVLENGLTEQRAIQLKKRINELPGLGEAGLSTRIIEHPKVHDKFELIIGRGYLAKEKANESLEKFRSFTSEFDAYVTGPQKIPFSYKKLKFIQNHFMDN
jgi:hypothetical protein